LLTCWGLGRKKGEPHTQKGAGKGIRQRPAATVGGKGDGVSILVGGGKNLDWDGVAPDTGWDDAVLVGSRDVSSPELVCWK